MLTNVLQYDLITTQSMEDKAYNTLTNTYEYEMCILIHQHKLYRTMCLGTSTDDENIKS